MPETHSSGEATKELTNQQNALRVDRAVGAQTHHFFVAGSLTFRYQPCADPPN